MAIDSLGAPSEDMHPKITTTTTKYAPLYHRGAPIRPITEALQTHGCATKEPFMCAKPLENAAHNSRRTAAALQGAESNDDWRAPEINVLRPDLV